MVFNLILNNTNVANRDNTRYAYKFISGGLKIYEGAEMCISQVIIPYSWYNVNAGLYNNNTISYFWSGTTSTFAGYGYITNDTTLNIVYFTGTALAVNDEIFGTGVPVDTYITSITTSYSNQGVYVLSQASTNVVPSSILGYIASSSQVYLNSTPTLPFAITNPVFTQLNSTICSSAPVSSLYTTTPTNYTYSAITATGYTQSSGTNIVLNGITSGSNGYYITGTGVPIGGTITYNTTNLVNYNQTATESATAYTLTNALLYSSALIYYQSQSGTYATTAILDSISGLISNGRTSLSQNTTNKSITVLGGLTPSSVAFTVAGYIPTTSTVQFIQNASLVANQYVFGTGLTTQTPYYTAVSGNYTATLAGTTGTATTATAINGYCPNSSSVVLASTIVNNTFITGSAISGTYTYNVGLSLGNTDYTLSNSTATPSTAVGTYSGASIYSPTQIVYISAPTGTPAIGNFIQLASNTNILGCTISALDATNFIITTTGFTMSVPTPTYTISGYVPTTSTLLVTGVTGLTTNMMVSSNVASANSNRISAINTGTNTITMPTASLTLSTTATISGYIKSISVLVSNNTIPSGYFITGTGINVPTSVSGSASDYTLNSYQTVPTPTTAVGTYTNCVSIGGNQFVYNGSTGTPAVGNFVDNTTLFTLDSGTIISIDTTNHIITVPAIVNSLPAFTSSFQGIISGVNTLFVSGTAPTLTAGTAFKNGGITYANFYSSVSNNQYTCSISNMSVTSSTGTVNSIILSNTLISNTTFALTTGVIIRGSPFTTPCYVSSTVASSSGHYGAFQLAGGFVPTSTSATTTIGAYIYNSNTIYYNVSNASLANNQFLSGAGLSIPTNFAWISAFDNVTAFSITFDGTFITPTPTTYQYNAFAVNGTNAIVSSTTGLSATGSSKTFMNGGICNGLNTQFITTLSGSQIITGGSFNILTSYSNLAYITGGTNFVVKQTANNFNGLCPYNGTTISDFASLTLVSNSTYTLSKTETNTTGTAYNAWFPNTTTIVFSSTTPNATNNMISGTGLTDGSYLTPSSNGQATIGGYTTTASTGTAITYGFVYLVSSTYYWGYIPSDTAPSLPSAGRFMTNSGNLPQDLGALLGTKGSGDFYPLTVASGTPTVSTSRFTTGGGSVPYYITSSSQIAVPVVGGYFPLVSPSVFDALTFGASANDGSQYSSNSTSSTQNYINIGNTVGTFTPTAITTTGTNKGIFTTATVITLNAAPSPVPVAGQFLSVPSIAGYTLSSIRVVSYNSVTPAVTLDTAITLPVSSVTMNFYTPAGTNLDLKATTSFTHYPATSVTVYTPTLYYIYTPALTNFITPQTISAFTPVANTYTTPTTINYGSNQGYTVSTYTPVSFTTYSNFNIGFTTPQSLSTFTPVSFNTYPPTTFSIYNSTFASLKAYTPVTYNLYPPLTMSLYSASAYQPNGTFNTLTLTDGNYNISTLNTALQNYMISKNQYLTQTSTGNKVFYINLSTSSTTYTDQFILTPIPTSLPSGYTAPTGFPYSANNYIPQIVISNYTGYYSLGYLIGFTGGIYPSAPTSTATTILSNTIPNLSIVNSIVVRCNLVNNAVSIPTDVLDTFSLSGVSFGNNIVYTPTYEKWIQIKDGNYDTMFVYFQDQNFNEIIANDNNVMISMLIKNGNKVKKENIVGKVEIVKRDLPSLDFKDRIEYD